MEQDSKKPNFDEMPVLPTEDRGPGWAIPVLVGAVVLVAGLMIFNAAGPERTQTAGVDTPTVTQSTARPQPANAPQNGNLAAPPTTVVPQKTNPAGTQ